MYRCSICQSVAQPKEPQRKWAVTRQLNNFRVVAGVLTNFPIIQTDREVVVCKDCHGCLSQGNPLEVVRQVRGKPAPTPLPPKAPPQPHEVRYPSPPVTQDESVSSAEVSTSITWTPAELITLNPVSEKATKKASKKRKESGGQKNPVSKRLPKSKKNPSAKRKTSL